MSEKKPANTRPSLVGHKVYLRPATAEDVANTHHWGMHSEQTYVSCRPHPMLTAPEAAERYAKREKSTSNQLFMIVRQKDSMPVGRISYFDMNTLNRSAEFGILMDPDEREKGYGLEAVRLLCAFLFRSFGLNKVYAQTGAFNEGAVGLLKKAGFKLDGTLRRHIFHQGEFHDAVIYSILQHEFER